MKNKERTDEDMIEVFNTLASVFSKISKDLDKRVKKKKEN